MNDINKTFLICHRGALGDFILTWPAILLLKKHFPEYGFIGLGRPDYMKLAIKIGILEGFHDSDSGVMLDFFENGIIPKELGKPEKGVLWLKDANGTAALLKKHSNTDFVPLEPFPSEKMHVAKFHIHGILKYLGIEEPFNPIDILPRFDFPQKNIILIHPGSGSQKKNYSPEFYLELAKFAETHLKKDVKFILGPVELEKGMNSFFPSDKMLSPRNASDLADILAGAFLFIGNDSGVGHLAGFLGIPTIALYRNTDPEIWGVVGRRVKWLDDAGETALLKKIKKFFFTVNNFEFFMSN